MPEIANNSHRKRSFRERVNDLKTELRVIVRAVKHPLTPCYAKVFAAIVVGYAFSPIDLIPDFIPVLGYIDDLILIPLGILAVKKMIPKSVYDECKTLVEKSPRDTKPYSWLGALIIVLVWIAIITFLALAIKDLPLRH